MKILIAAGAAILLLGGGAGAYAQSTGGGGVHGGPSPVYPVDRSTPGAGSVGTWNGWNGALCDGHPCSDSGAYSIPVCGMTAPRDASAMREPVPGGPPSPQVTILPCPVPGAVQVPQPVRGVEPHHHHFWQRHVHHVRGVAPGCAVDQPANPTPAVPSSPGCGAMQPQ